MQSDTLAARMLNFLQKCERSVFKRSVSCRFDWAKLDRPVRLHSTFAVLSRSHSHKPADVKRVYFNAEISPAAACFGLGFFFLSFRMILQA